MSIALELFFSGISRSLGFYGGGLGVLSGALGKEGGSDGRDKGKEAYSRPPSLDTCLGGTVDGTCLSGYRRTSALYEIVSGFAMLFFGLCAGVSLARSQPGGKRTDICWLATSAACAIASGLFLVAAVTGKIWLFGL